MKKHLTICQSRCVKCILKIIPSFVKIFSGVGGHKLRLGWL